MKNNKLFVFISFAVIPLFSLAQTKETFFDKYQNSIFFAPMNVLDYINPSLQIGYERMLNSRMAVQVEAAYILNHSLENYLIDMAYGNFDCPYFNKGFKVRGEFKFYFTKTYNSMTYFSGELFYLKNLSKESDTFEISDPNFDYQVPHDPDANAYDELFTLDRQRFGLNLKIGSKNFIDKHFFIEPHIGIGLVYRISKHYDRMNLNDELYYGFISLHNKAGNMWLANLPLNVKIGYSF